jgi:hypothetical protein
MLSASSKSIRSEKTLVITSRSDVILYMYSDNTCVLMWRSRRSNVSVIGFVNMIHTTCRLEADDTNFSSFKSGAVNCARDRC